jgi:hypothetical protein
MEQFNNFLITKLSINVNNLGIHNDRYIDQWFKYVLNMYDKTDDEYIKLFNRYIVKCKNQFKHDMLNKNKKYMYEIANELGLQIIETYNDKIESEKNNYDYFLFDEVRCNNKKCKNLYPKLFMDSKKCYNCVYNYNDMNYQNISLYVEKKCLNVECNNHFYDLNYKNNQCIKCINLNLNLNLDLDLKIKYHNNECINCERNFVLNNTYKNFMCQNCTINDYETYDVNELVDIIFDKALKQEHLSNNITKYLNCLKYDKLNYPKYQCIVCLFETTEPLYSKKYCSNDRCECIVCITCVNKIRSNIIDGKIVCISNITCPNCRTLINHNNKLEFEDNILNDIQNYIILKCINCKVICKDARIECNNINNDNYNDNDNRECINCTRSRIEQIRLFEEEQLRNRLFEEEQLRRRTELELFRIRERERDIYDINYNGELFINYYFNRNVGPALPINQIAPFINYQNIEIDQNIEINHRTFADTSIIENMSNANIDKIIYCSKCDNYMLKIIKNNGIISNDCNHIRCSFNYSHHICGFANCGEIFDTSEQCYSHMRITHGSYYDDIINNDDGNLFIN